jgi:hypothetical protein
MTGFGISLMVEENRDALDDVGVSRRWRLAAGG